MVLDILTMATTEDWYIVMKLTTTNANLAEVVKNLTYQLEVSMSTIQYLTKVTEKIQGTNKTGTEEKSKRNPALFMDMICLRLRLHLRSYASPLPQR